jgi:hypothetical protein
MRSNSVVASVLCVAVVAGLAAWLAVEHQAALRLGEEHQALELQLKQLAELRAQNEQLAIQAGQANTPPSLPEDQARELLRLRGEVGLLRQQSKDLEAVRSENRQAQAGAGIVKAAATGDYWPRDSWGFAGYASPEAALQSSLWAASSGDSKALLASTTGDARAEMEKEFGEKPETEASIRLMDGISSLKSVRVLNREVQGDDTAVLSAEFEARDFTNTSKLHMKRIGNEWKVAGEGH